jgi:hypothetical protein
MTQDRETHLRGVAAWKFAYAQLSERQRNRKIEIKEFQRSIEELPVFSYVWPQERQDEWNLKYGRSYGSYTSYHSKLQLAVNDVALQAQAMLRIRSEMRAQAGRDTSLVPTVAVAS